MNPTQPAPQGHTPELTIWPEKTRLPDTTAWEVSAHSEARWFAFAQTKEDAELIRDAVSSHTRLQSENRALREALEELYRDEKLDDDDSRLMATRAKVSALLTTLNPTEHKKS